MTEVVGSRSVPVEKPWNELLVTLPFIVINAVVSLALLLTAVGVFIEDLRLDGLIWIGLLAIIAMVLIPVVYLLTTVKKRTFTVDGESLRITQGSKQLLSLDLADIKEIAVKKPGLKSDLLLNFMVPGLWFAPDLGAVIITPKDVWQNDHVFDVLIAKANTAWVLHAQLQRIMPDVPFARDLV